MSKERAELFGTFGSNFDLVLVAIVICQVERDHALMPNQASEQGNGTLSLDIVPSYAEVHDRLVVVLKNASQLLKTHICDTVLTDVELGELRVIFHDLADDVHRLISKAHLSQVQFASACDFMVLYDQIKEAEHLLL